MKMNNKDIRFEKYLIDILYSLEGKITKTQFKKITKFYNWKFEYKTIHIVGTNGKGTNAKFINDELIYNKYKVGLFTSPHVESMYERIKINNKNIEFDSMTKFVSDLKYNFPNINFGWFDVFFLSAINLFEKARVDVAIFEAGIGAKKDVVNYINHDYLLITSISMDHEKILGKSLDKICEDKSYAIKNNAIVFISGSINEKYLNFFINKCKKERCPYFVSKTNRNDTFDIINEKLSKLILKKVFSISKFKSYFILPRARVEKVKINEIDCYIDVAHNLESFEESIKYFEKNKINFDQIFVSLSNDKDSKKIFDFLDKKFGTIYVYENKGRKPLKIFQYNEKYPKVLNLKYFLKKIDSKTLFIGSFYLASEIFETLKE